MTQILLFSTHLLIAGLAFLVGTRLRAASYHRRIQAIQENANQRIKEHQEYADGCLRTANQAETWGFKRGYDKGMEDGKDVGRVDGVAVGINLRDQIDQHFGDYSQ